MVRPWSRLDRGLQSFAVYQKAVRSPKGFVPGQSSAPKAAIASVSAWIAVSFRLAPIDGLCSLMGQGWKPLRDIDAFGQPWSRRMVEQPLEGEVGANNIRRRASAKRGLCFFPWRGSRFNRTGVQRKSSSTILPLGTEPPQARLAARDSQSSKSARGRRSAAVFRANARPASTCARRTRADEVSAGD